MAGEATVCFITQIRKHPNADRLQVATVLGEDVIVGLNAQVQDRMVYFDCETQLSEPFCIANDLLARYDMNGVKIGGGYFDQKRRVRAQSFRGIKSNGFVVPLSYFDYCGASPMLSNQPEGYTFTSLNGHEICKRYYVAPIAMKMQGVRLPRKKIIPFFYEHFDTDNLRYHLKDVLHEGDRLIITAKVHGTSARLFHGVDPAPFRFKWLNNLYKEYGKPMYKHWVGSRKVLKGAVEHTYPDISQEYPNLGRRWPKFKRYLLASGLTREQMSYYGDADFFRIYDVKDIKLRKGETLFSEHVGYLSNGMSIMPSIDFKKLPKNIQSQYKQYWDNAMYFSYGCEKYDKGIGRRLLVYRITQLMDDHIYDLPWEQTKLRCYDLGLEHVHELISMTIPNYMDKWNIQSILNALIPDLATYVERPDPLDHRHYMEGICIRIEKLNGHMNIFKYKSHTFLVGEGIVKDNDTVDMEEQESIT